MPVPLGRPNTFTAQFLPQRGALLASWSVPLRGVMNNYPIHAIPNDALYLGHNVTIRNGWLQQRPGLAKFGSALSGRVTGLYQTGTLSGAAFEATAFEPTAFQEASNVQSSLLIAATTTHLYYWSSGKWNDVTGSALAASDYQMARMTSLYVNALAKLKIFHCNGNDTLREWDGSSATFAVTAGSPPTFTDVAAISDHIVGLVPPFTVQWCNNQDPATWPALNKMTISMRGDRVVAIRPIGQYGGVVYKTNSLWTLFPQGGAESTFFVPNDRGSYEGPASANAVVDANGTHLWLTPNGRVGAFDGASVQWVADGVWPLVKANIDIANANRVFGVFDPAAYEVTFYYPRTGDNGDCYGMVLVVLPRPQDGIDSYIAFTGTASFAMSGGGDTRLDLRLALVADKNGQVYSVGGQQDVMTNFSGYWQTGLSPTESLEMYGLDAVEVYAQRAPGNGSLSIQAVTSYILDTAGGTLSTTTKTVNLGASTVFDPLGTDARGRFFGVYGSFSSPITLRYYGARLGASPRKG